MGQRPDGKRAWSHPGLFESAGTDSTNAGVVPGQLESVTLTDGNYLASTAYIVGDRGSIDS